jgi:D-3-phosphoglycerate dehydrogenase
MKILVTPTSFLKPENKAAQEKLAAFADEVVYNPHGRPLTAEEIPALLEGCDGYIAGLDYITAEAIQAAPDTLKVISRYGAGVDRVDLKAAKVKGITVTNTPGTNATAVCELAFGLMLALARGIPQLDRAVKQGEWPRRNGIELCGKTLAVLGLGAIGKKLACRAQAFGMEVCAYDPYADKAYARAVGIDLCGLKETISKADFISLHMPLTEETRHILGAKEIAAMREGVYIINTARGGLIDEQAACEALKTGRIAGLGLDVYEGEPPSDSPLMGLSNVITTPHAGAHTQEAVSGMGLMAVENLIAVLTGGECEFIVK